MKKDPLSISNLLVEFEAWRREKTSPTERVPEVLIERARRVATVHGAASVAYQIGVARSRLTSCSADSNARDNSLPSFSRVEISAPSSTGSLLVEAETPSGMKLRLYAITPETVGLVSSFCRSGVCP